LDALEVFVYFAGMQTADEALGKLIGWKFARFIGLKSIELMSVL